MITVRMIRHRWARLDWLSLAATFALMVVGVLFIFSAAYQTHRGEIQPFYRKQILWCVIGLISYLTVAAIDYRRLAAWSGALYGMGALLLVAVLFVGVKVNGAYRWLNVGGIYVQPSELAKLTTVILMARVLSRPGISLRRPSTLYGTLAIAALPFGLIMMEPDLGTAAVLAPVTVVMLFAAGVPLRYLLLLAVVALALSPAGWFALGDYQRERLLVFLDPGRDPLGAGWNKIQSEIAVGCGGLWGKGFLKGTQNILGFLPRTVAPTDFIFSVIAEEAGFMGGVGLIGLFAVMFTRAMHVAAVARDRFGQLLTVGLATLLFAHVFVNIAMTIGLMPITGLPLPLISYGGSFMVSSLLALGLIQSVYIRRFIL